jgi:hypothetical protein
MKERFDRDYMQDLLRRARRERDDLLNPEWIMAYDNFIFACSVLDAFFARSTGPSVEGSQPTEIGAEPCIAPVCDCDEHSGCRAGTSQPI